MNVPLICFHTNRPAPYRRHQFELLAAEFKNARFYFTCARNNSYRPWAQNYSEWKCDCRVVSWTRKIRDLIFQPWGTVHVVAYTGGGVFNVLLILSAYIGHSKRIRWNDAGFPEKVDIHARRRWPVWLRIYRWMIFKADFAVYTAGDLGRRFSLARGYAPNQIVNTYFSHDIDKFVSYRKAHYAEARTRIRRKLGIKDSSVSSLNISRYLDCKRLCDLAQAFTVLEDRHPDVAKRCELIIIGEGECKAHLPLLEKLKLVKVHLVRQIPPDEVLEYYCAADLFAFPSEGDIWGLVVNEALSMGLPVICTDKIGAAELVNDGTNGYCIPIRDPDALADRILRLVEDDRLRVRFSEAALTIGDYWRTEFGVKALADYLRRA